MDEAPFVLLLKLKSATLAKKPDEVGIPGEVTEEPVIRLCIQTHDNRRNHNPGDQGESRWEIFR